MTVTPAMVLASIEAIPETPENYRARWEAIRDMKTLIEHPALADPEGIALVQEIHDRKNGQAEKAGPSSAMAETGRRGGESPDRLGSSGNGGR